MIWIFSAISRKVQSSNHFLVQNAIQVSASLPGPWTIRGDGWGSNILWDHDDHLFAFDTPVAEAIVTDIAISSIGTNKSPNSTAINFAGGLAKSVIERVLFYGAGDVPGVAQKASLLGSAIDMGAISDTSAVVDCVVWFCHGVGECCTLKVKTKSSFRPHQNQLFFLM